MPGLHLPQRIIDGDFGGWLRQAMRDRRLSTRAVAMRTGVNHTTISRLMRNAREPVLSTAIALLRLLGRDQDTEPRLSPGDDATPAGEEVEPKKAA